MRSLVLVDFSNIVHRCNHAYSKIKLNRKGVFIGGVLGVIHSIKSICREVNPELIIFCKDTPPYERTKVFPDYKRDRSIEIKTLGLPTTIADKKRREDAENRKRYKETEKLLTDFLTEFGIPIWQESGFEADDIIAHTVKTYKSQYDKIYAVSSDADLHQLFVYEAFELYQKAGTFFTREHFRKKYRIRPNKIALMLALSGTHNNVKGIPRVAEITAQKMILSETQYVAVFKENKKLIERNLKLIELPYRTFKPTAEMRIEKIVYKPSFRKLLRFCDKNEIVLDRMTSSLLNYYCNNI